MSSDSPYLEIDPVSEAKIKICRKMRRMLGHNVVGMSDTLSMLTGPDLLPLLEELIKEVKSESTL